MEQERKTMLDEIVSKLGQIAADKGYVTDEDIFAKMATIEFTAEDTEYVYDELEAKNITHTNSPEVDEAKPENIERIITFIFSGFIRINTTGFLQSVGFGQ